MPDNNEVYDALIAEAKIDTDGNAPSYEELASQLEFAKTEQARLTTLNEYYNNLLIGERNKARQRASDLEEYLDENWEELGDHAATIAGIFGIEVTKTVSLEITVAFTVEVIVPRGQEDDISESDFDFEVTQGSYSDVEIESSDYSIVTFN
jgi:predicted RNA-binding Zn ribbon-like protein